MSSFIKPDQTWILWAFIVGWATVSLHLESKYKWAAKVSSPIIALTGALVLSNLNIIPTASPVYDSVWSYVIPLSIPMLLFQCNIKKIWKESGRLLLIFVIGGIGTFFGALIGYGLLHEHIPGLEYAATIMTGSYIGGGVNFVALSDAVNAPSNIIAATTVADNLLMVLYFFVLLSLPTIAFFKKQFSHPYIDEAEAQMAVSTGSNEQFELSKSSGAVTVKDVAFTFATAVVIVTVSDLVASFCAAQIPTSNPVLALFNSLFGNMYLILTTLTMLLATFAPKYFAGIQGAQETGMFLMMIFMVVIGTPASIKEIVESAPLLLLFCAIMVAVNMLVTFLCGKIFKFTLEECIISSNANIGGPATASAMAITKGWTGLVGPSVLVSVFGYVIGNYFGIIVGNILL